MIMNSKTTYRFGHLGLCACDCPLAFLTSGQWGPPDDRDGHCSDAPLTDD